MKKRFALVLLMLLMLPVAGSAAGGEYIFLSGGIDLPEGDNVKAPVYFSGFDISAKKDSGYYLGAGVGGRFSESLRMEGELSYRSQEIDRIEGVDMMVTGIGLDGGDGTIGTTAAMLNAWLDLPLIPFLSPYLGGGIGAAQVRMADLAVTTHPVIPDASRTRSSLIDDNDWRFAYQVGAGVGFEMSLGLVVDFGYRYFATADPEFVDEGGSQVRIQNRHSDFIVTARFDF